MKTIKLMSAFLALFSCIILSKSFAQHTLEEVKIYDNYDVRLLDINNQGMVCGYYIRPIFNTEVGFLITPSGKLFHVFPVTGFDHARVISINDRDTPTILLKMSNTTALNGAASVYKAYYFPEGDSISTPSSITLSPNNPHPTRINNKNYMMGWYAQGAAIHQPRYMWIYFDSLAAMPANHTNQYYATRYVQPPNSVKPTFGGGINDNGIACGYYYDSTSTNYTSFIFNVNTNAFTPLTNVSNRLLHDINNSGFVVGKLSLGGNDRALMGTYSGNTLTVIPNTIFGGVPMNSEYTGVNDKEEIVGNYQHPVTNKWIGFIYRRNTTEYRLPGFDFEKHTWKMKNNHDLNTTPNDTNIWTNKYFGNYDYKNMDPLSSQPISITKNTSISNFFIDKMSSPSWYGFCYEMDSLSHGGKANNSTADSIRYQGTEKSIMMNKYINEISDQYGNLFYTTNSANDTFFYGKFGGYCYGFTYTALQKLYDSARFKDWFDFSQNIDAKHYTNSDTHAILAIERTQFKQGDKKVVSKYGVSKFKSVSVWSGLFRLKNEYAKTKETTNPRGASLIVPGGWHEILPYKIKTPQSLPFDHPTQKYDTLFIYDSNSPGDSMQHFLIKNDLAVTSLAHDSFTSNNYSLVKSLNFNEPGVKDLPEIFGHKERSSLKPTSINAEDSLYALCIRGSKEYSLFNDANDSATLTVAAGWESGIEDLIPKIPFNKAPVPNGYLYDTAQTLTFNTRGYENNSLMRWESSNTVHSIGISRIPVGNNEKDYGVSKHRYWAYGTKDNVTKPLMLHYIQKDFGNQYGVNYNIQNFETKQDDSLITFCPSDYQYQIIRIGGDSINYDLNLIVIDNGTVRTLDETIPMSGNTTHIIEPYYNGPNGNQIVIYVDNGNTGSYNDTLFIDPTGTGIKNIINVDYITIYPNPATDILNVTIDKNSTASYQLVISDLTGKTIAQNRLRLKDGSAQIVLNHITKGLYIVQIIQDGKPVYIQKIIKN